MVTSAEERRAGAPAQPYPGSSGRPRTPKAPRRSSARGRPLRATSEPVLAREERNRARQLRGAGSGAWRCGAALRRAEPCAKRGPGNIAAAFAYRERFASAEELRPSHGRLSPLSPSAPCSAVCRCGSAGCRAGSTAGSGRTYLKRSTAFPSPDRGTATNNAQ